MKRTKKILCILTSMLLAISLIACGAQPQAEEDPLPDLQTALLPDRTPPVGEYRTALPEENPETADDELSDEPSLKTYTLNLAPMPMTSMQSTQRGFFSGIFSSNDSSGESWRFAEQTPQEEYDNSPDMPFKDVLTSPLSTFSADVDTASYSNIRRQINDGCLPDGVRIEEMVNYFDYGYEQPKPGSEHPFSVTAEVAPCPWNKDAQLVMLGVQAAQLQAEEAIASNIVFLIDVSGSMYADNKLPLLQESFKLMLGQLGPKDVVSIVTYAGSDMIVAEGLAGNNTKRLHSAIDSLMANGSTAGAKGLNTAYRLAEKYFIENGNNRIILATDGDFNVGPSGPAEMQSLVERKRKSGIFISVLGFGMYNLKDNTMEAIADYGNGNYAYIDTLDEARKVLVDEFNSTMYTVAKDFKLQVEFNPAVISQYRLIGYNNRILQNEDFNNDQKDAGDIGAGHSVTALYEIIPADGAANPLVDELKYQQQSVGDSSDYLNVKIRYKLPDENTSRLVEYAVTQNHYGDVMSAGFGWAAAVAEFGLVLSDCEYMGDASASSARSLAIEYIGADEYGLRAEFIDLIELYRRNTD